MTSELLVQTDSGPVNGYINTHSLSIRSTQHLDAGSERPVKQWLGIPYAKAGRWEHAQQPDAWTTTRDCFEYGSQFIQPPSKVADLVSAVPGYMARDFIANSEDSFYLNVYTPANAGPSTNLPVMVWIYGGSLNNGAASLTAYDGAPFVRRSEQLDQPCILVTFNYRIGIFGYLGHADLAEGDPQGLTGNYGTRDAIAALEWVQRNIAAFGGDPENVTAFGESAGSYIASLLLVSGRKLFKRVILQSAGPSTIGTTHLAKACPWYSDMLKEFNIPSTGSASERVAALRAVPAKELLDYSQSVFALGTWQTILESGSHAIFKKSVVHSLMHGEYDPWVEAAIIGVNQDEGTLFAMATQFRDPEKLGPLLSNYPKEGQEQLKYLYDLPNAKATDALAETAGAKILGDSIFDAPFIHTARLLASVPNVTSGKTMKVFAYQLQVAPSQFLPVPSLKSLGVGHSFDLPFVFNCTNIFGGNSSDIAISKAIGRRWNSFAHSSTPADWPVFDADEGSALLFQADGQTEVASFKNFKKDKMAFWFKVIEARASSTLEKEILGATSKSKH